MKPRHRYLCFLTLTSVIFVSAALTQARQQKSDSPATQSPLQGTTEALLANGQPALRVVSRKNGSTEISYLKRDGEDAIVFSVMHWHAFGLGSKPGESGRLYVTPTRFVYDPDGEKGHFFNVSRTEVKEAKAAKGGRWGRDAIGPHIRIETKDSVYQFAVAFSNGSSRPDGGYMSPVTEYFGRAVTNFGAALTEFRQLTAGVRPESENGEEEETEEEAAEVTERYDRFRDVTVVRTSRMRMSGGKRSLRIFAEFSYPGKTPRRPEKVILSFFGSAPRPVFRDDDLELNFLVDGERVPAGVMRLVEEEKAKTMIRQIISVSLPYDTFEKIANAKKVELQVGSLEYSLTSIHLEIFRRLLGESTHSAAPADNPE